MRFCDWELKKGGEIGSWEGGLTVSLWSWVSPRHKVPSIYRAASPQGQTTFHSDYNERKKNRGRWRWGEKNKFSCILESCKSTTPKTYKFSRGCCRRRPVTLYILSIHYTWTRENVLQLIGSLWKTTFLTVQRTCVAVSRPLLAPHYSPCVISNVLHAKWRSFWQRHLIQRPPVSEKSFQSHL